MALREILIWPDPRLKLKAKPVAKVDAAIRQLCDDMAETMYAANGVGLAAPQIGVPLHVISMDVEQRASSDEDGEIVDAKKPGAGLFWMINPVLKVAEGEFTYTEGCLSVPDEYEDVTRFGHIVVEYTTRDGERVTREASNNLFAVCVQHEMDHLQGKLFVDHISALKREIIKRRMKKLKVDRAAEAAGDAATL
jgi:peptide deformylase